MTDDGQLQPMLEEAFSSEDRLQELVANYPSLLGGEQINPENHKRFVLVGREQGIADVVGGSNRWALDHLFIDQDAIPTLVEAKRSTNSEIRRFVVGQMMDYAAHATQSWNASDIRKAFEERSPDPEGELAQLLQAEPEADKFWNDVETNLRAARIRLLFVADGIPDELARVVEFMNEQMPRIEVLAVEVKQFQGDKGSTLVPRVIGRTSEAIAAPTRLSGARISTNRERYLGQMEQLGFRQTVERLFQITDSRPNGTLEWGSIGASVRGRCKVWNQPLTVAWLYPIPETNFWSGTRNFTFGAGNASPGFFESLPQDLRSVLENWAKQFEDFQQHGGTLVESPGLIGWAIPHETAAANIDLLCERLQRVFQELSELQPEQG